MALSPALWAQLATFAEVARSMSFTQAADRLCITQGAVSQRIKTLEQQLGFRLFVRLTRQLTLTSEGARLLGVLSPALQHVGSEIQDIRAHALSGELYLGVAPTFAQTWLLPRLPAFQQQFPELNLRLRVKASRLNFQNEPVDLAIYYSNLSHPGFYCQRLYDEWLLPVCSPHYAARLALTQGVKALTGARFIHCTESIDSLSPFLEWQHWLHEQGEVLDVQQRQTVFNHAEMALQAAISGMGVAMGRRSLLTAALRDGRLVAPFPACPSGYGYDLICPAGEEKRPRFAAFAGWLAAQVVAVHETGLTA